MSEARYTLHLGDCLELMAQLPDGSVDMILCDLPYGTTDCKWDSIIPLEPLWAHYKRVIKRNGAIVLTACQPFTTKLISSNMGMFKYCWVWEKAKGANFASSGFQPLKVVEDIVVFSEGACTFTKNGNGMPYNPQKILLEKPRTKIGNSRATAANTGFKFPYAVEYTHASPRNLLYASPQKDKRVHPTQKPVALMEYMIRTYTTEGEVVMDNCMGSGSTGVACINAGRKFIGIEREAEYMEIAKSRIEAAIAGPPADLLTGMTLPLPPKVGAGETAKQEQLFASQS